MINPDEHIRYDGIYGGVVTDNKDPLMLHRVKISLGVLGEEVDTDWAIPTGRIAGNGWGWFGPPEIGDAVQVGFVEGDPEAALYHGGYWASPNGVIETPIEFQRVDPTNRGFKSPGGHLDEFDDLASSQAIRRTTIAGFKFHMDDANQKLFIETPGGHKIELNDATNELTLISAGDKKETVGGGWTINVTGAAKINASVIELNGAGSDVTTKAGHGGVIDLITGAPIVTSGLLKSVP